MLLQFQADCKRLATLFESWHDWSRVQQLFDNYHRKLPIQLCDFLVEFAISLHSQQISVIPILNHCIYPILPILNPPNLSQTLDTSSFPSTEHLVSFVSMKLVQMELEIAYFQCIIDPSFSLDSFINYLNNSSGLIIELANICIQIDDFNLASRVMNLSLTISRHYLNSSSPKMSSSTKISSCLSDLLNIILLFDSLPKLVSPKYSNFLIQTGIQICQCLLFYEPADLPKIFDFLTKLEDKIVFIEDINKERLPNGLGLSSDDTLKISNCRHRLSGLRALLSRLDQSKSKSTVDIETLPYFAQNFTEFLVNSLYKVFTDTKLDFSDLKSLSNQSLIVKELIDELDQKSEDNQIFVDLSSYEFLNLFIQILAGNSENLSKSDVSTDTNLNTALSILEQWKSEEFFRNFEHLTSPAMFIDLFSKYLPNLPSKLASSFCLFLVRGFDSKFIYNQISCQVLYQSCLFLSNSNLLSCSFLVPILLKLTQESLTFDTGLSPIELGELNLRLVVRLRERISVLISEFNSGLTLTGTPEFFGLEKSNFSDLFSKYCSLHTEILFTFYFSLLWINRKPSNSLKETHQSLINSTSDDYFRRVLVDLSFVLVRARSLVPGDDAWLALESELEMIVSQAINHFDYETSSISEMINRKEFITIASRLEGSILLQNSHDPSQSLIPLACIASVSDKLTLSCLKSSKANQIFGVGSSWAHLTSVTKNSKIWAPSNPARSILIGFTDKNQEITTIGKVLPTLPLSVFDILVQSCKVSSIIDHYGPIKKSMNFLLHNCFLHWNKLDHPNSSQLSFLKLNTDVYDRMSTHTKCQCAVLVFTWVERRSPDKLTSCSEILKCLEVLLLVLEGIPSEFNISNKIAKLITKLLSLPPLINCKSPVNSFTTLCNSALSKVFEINSNLISGELIVKYSTNHIHFPDLIKYLIDDDGIVVESLVDQNLNDFDTISFVLNKSKLLVFYHKHNYQSNQRDRFVTLTNYLLSILDKISAKLNVNDKKVDKKEGKKQSDKVKSSESDGLKILKHYRNFKQRKLKQSLSSSIIQPKALLLMLKFLLTGELKSGIKSVILFSRIQSNSIVELLPNIAGFISQINSFEAFNLLYHCDYLFEYENEPFMFLLFQIFSTIKSQPYYQNSKNLKYLVEIYEKSLSSSSIYSFINSFYNSNLALYYQKSKQDPSYYSDLIQQSKLVNNTQYFSLFSLNAVLNKLTDPNFSKKSLSTVINDLLTIIDTCTEKFDTIDNFELPCASVTTTNPVEKSLLIRSKYKSFFNSFSITNSMLLIRASVYLSFVSNQETLTNSALALGSSLLLGYAADSNQRPISFFDCSQCRDLVVDDLFRAFSLSFEFATPNIQSFLVFLSKSLVKAVLGLGNCQLVLPLSLLGLSLSKSIGNIYNLFVCLFANINAKLGYLENSITFFVDHFYGSNSDYKSAVELLINQKHNQNDCDDVLFNFTRCFLLSKDGSQLNSSEFNSLLTKISATPFPNYLKAFRAFILFNCYNSVSQSFSLTSTLLRESEEYNDDELSQFLELSEFEFELVFQTVFSINAYKIGNNIKDLNSFVKGKLLTELKRGKYWSLYTEVILTLLVHDYYFDVSNFGKTLSQEFCLSSNPISVDYCKLYLATISRLLSPENFDLSLACQLLNEIYSFVSGYFEEIIYNNCFTPMVGIFIVFLRIYFSLPASQSEIMSNLNFDRRLLINQLIKIVKIVPVVFRHHFEDLFFISYYHQLDLNTAEMEEKAFSSAESLFPVFNYLSSFYLSSKNPEKSLIYSYRYKVFKTINHELSKQVTSPLLKRPLPSWALQSYLISLIRTHSTVSGLFLFGNLIVVDSFNYLLIKNQLNNIISNKVEVKGSTGVVFQLFSLHSVKIWFISNDLPVKSIIKSCKDLDELSLRLIKLKKEGNNDFSCILNEFIGFSVDVELDFDFLKRLLNYQSHVFIGDNDTDNDRLSVITKAI
ncbi:hypothetical protein P9112_007480 [Eukaryota sp. TZLM1-RC]